MAKQCPKAGACGACRYNGVKYSNQLARKQACLEDLIGEFGPVAPIIGMDNPFHYRNKIQSVFGVNSKGEPICGIYRLGTHNIIPVHDCMLEDEKGDAVLCTILELVRRLGISIYDEDEQTGFLRHVLIRRAVSTDQTMVVLVASSFTFRQKNAFVSILLERHPEIRTILVNRNAEKTSMVLSEEPEKILHGDGYIEDYLCGLTFRISAKSFYQVNPYQAEKLYRIAMRMARFSGEEKVIDAYCGTGTIGLIAAASGAGNVTGIELNPSAVEDAVYNSKLNGLSNASFICGDASAVLKDMAKSHESADVVFMDPPRAGSDERFLSSVIKLAPKTIIYISCNPETLARDLRYITKFGPYYVYGAQGVDMFPQTEHVETVVLLNNLNSNGKEHASVDVNMDEHRKVKEFDQCCVRNE